MRKAAHPSGGMDSSNPHRWRGEQLHHHGDGVCLLFVLFCAVSSDRRHSSYVDKYESNLKVGLLMKQSVPPRLAPYRLVMMGTRGVCAKGSCGASPSLEDHARQDRDFGGHACVV